MNRGLFFVPEPADQESLEQDTSIESAPLTNDQISLTQQTTQPLLSPKTATKTRFLVPASILLINLALLALVFFLDVLPVLTQSVTVTIIPKSQAINTTQTLATVQSRVLPPLTLSKTQTVNATG